MLTEKTIEIKICRHCQASFDITDKDIEMLDKISPVVGDKKFQIPTPTLCPDCRLQRKLAFRLDTKLYRRTCDFSGKKIISSYSPDKKFKVYDQDIWKSDKRDPLEYGQTMDLSKPFFQQFDQLLKNVPRFGVMNEDAENSDYCHHSSHLKNCYLIFGSANDQDCYYGYRVIDCENACDSVFATKSKNMYESVDIENCHNVFFCQKCKDCSYSRYLYNCENCHNCLGCVNLNNASYCIENKEYAKEDYPKAFAQAIEKINRKKFSEFSLKFPRRYCDIIHSENVIGDGIYNSKNIFMGFNVHDAENVRYSYDLYNRMINCMDCFSGYGPVDRSYDTISNGVGGYNVFFCYSCYPGTNTFYSFYCFGCSDIFGCVGLRNKQYCIFNTQYTKADYEKEVQRIISRMMGTGERGEFIDPQMSDFCYNETVAMDYFPLTKEEAIKQGFKWSDYANSLPQVEKILKADELPDIHEVTDEILNQAIICEVTGKPFRIIKQELDFYRKHDLPLPRRHPDIRHTDRMAMRNPRKLFDRKCDKCGVDIKTSYSPERPEMVYCEQCYNKEIYG